MIYMERALNLSQDRELLASVIRQLPSLRREVAQYWIGNPKELEKTLATALACREPDLYARKGDVEIEASNPLNFYLGFFGPTSRAKITEEALNFIKKNWHPTDLEGNIGLAEVKPQDFGLVNDCTAGSVIEKAKHFGMIDCPYQAAITIAACTPLTSDKTYVIGRTPEQDENGEEMLVMIRTYASENWVIIEPADSLRPWHRWLFIRPSKKD